MVGKLVLLTIYVFIEPFLISINTWFFVFLLALFANTAQATRVILKICSECSNMSNVLGSNQMKNIPSFMLSPLSYKLGVLLLKHNYWIECVGGKDTNS